MVKCKVIRGVGQMALWGRISDQKIILSCHPPVPFPPPSPSPSELGEKLIRPRGSLPPFIFHKCTLGPKPFIEVGYFKAMRMFPGQRRTLQSCRISGSARVPRHQLCQLGFPQVTHSEEFAIFQSGASAAVTMAHFLNEQTS